MYIEYLHPIRKFRQVDIYLTVETSGTKKCLVKHIGAVGGGKDYHTIVGSETIHCRKHLVKSILSFVVASHIRVLASGTAYCIDFIYEHYTGGFLLGLFEQVAHTGCAYTDKHFDEIRT